MKLTRHFSQQWRHGCRVIASALLAGLLLVAPASRAQIPQPTDAPRPLSPEESATHFKVPPGFKLELIASEPVIQEPSGVCWDEQGRLFVTELHGFNLEGQYDIEELNKTGQLDRIPRRIPASDAAKQAAEAGTFGTVKLLLDEDHDGLYEKAEVWANDLPPCYGACPARGGIIVCCAPQIVFLADRDGDNKPDVREVLFTGLASGLIDRGVSNPQWGPDGWIYFGKGNGGATVTGPRLPHPVELPNTDFRIKPDGSAIEPVVGGSHTFGFGMTGLGDRFVTSTGSPAIWVAPLTWHSLQRNPYVAIPELEFVASGYHECYPTSAPHPWRQKRADDPGFSKYYTDRYGKAESTPNGYFTSACSPLVYQDMAIPALQGQVLTCEPAQNLIHRARIVRHGSRLLVERMPDESESEFLTSDDSWFHPIAMSQAPDGTICITDFYREIIEDYSAVPRYLQQIYGVVNGKDRGRLWRLTHVDLQAAPEPQLSQLSAAELAREVVSDYAWRRETAQRLLVEAQAAYVAPPLRTLLAETTNPRAVFAALNTLDQLGALSFADLQFAIAHQEPEIRRLGIQLAESKASDVNVLALILTRIDDEPLVRRQLASSLGAFDAPQADEALVALARQSGDELLMSPAVLSSAANKSGAMLKHLLASPQEIGQARSILESLAATVAGRRNSDELSAAISAIAACPDRRMQSTCLEAIAGSAARTKSANPQPTDLESTALDALKQLAAGSAREVRAAARHALVALSLETEAERAERIAAATACLGNPAIPAAAQLDAVEQLIADDSPESTQALLNGFAVSTPQVQDAILAALLSRRDHMNDVLQAIESQVIPAGAVSALQRSTLLESRDAAVRRRAQQVFAAASSLDETRLQAYVAALEAPRDPQHGFQVFKDRCAICHNAHGVGKAVGPDLTAEFQRAEEALIRDLLAPSDAIAAGYQSYIVQTRSGQTHAGLVSVETPTSVTLLQAEGKETVILRSDIEELRATSVSLMPDDLVKVVTPRDFADLIHWLRQPPAEITLLDDAAGILAEFDSGDGTAEMRPDDAYSGKLSLYVTPLQRYSARMKNWDFRIREKPQPGEFRYLRLAWKTTAADGVMLELAANGQWPPANRAARRYYAGQNTSPWKAVEVSAEAPRAWTVVTLDLWAESGDFTLTGLAPTALGAAVQFDKIELLRQVDNPRP